jgi:hypothetical protein
MKKILGIIVLSLLLSGNAYALTQQEAIDQYLKDRKLDTIEGIWIDSKNGTIQVTYKSNNEYFCRTIQSRNVRSGFKFCDARGSNNSYSGSMLVNKGKLSVNLTITIYGNNRTDYLSNSEFSMSANLKRLWPDDIVSHNAKYKTDEDIKNDEKELALIVNDVKKTCGILGFEPGSEKFADCTLKLYTQKIDEKIAAKQEANNRSLQTSSSSTTTQSSSGTNTTIIYDPVRDKQNKIDRGMKMLGGKCTLGVDC